MALQVNDIVTVTWMGTLLAQRIMTILHYRVTQNFGAGSLPTDMQTIADKFRAGVGGADFMESDYLACLPSNYQLDSIRVQAIKTVRSVIKETVRLTAGTRPTAATTANVAAYTLKRTDFGGRKQVGSVHLPLASGDYSAGEPTAAYNIAAGNFRGKLLNTVALLPAGQLSPVIYHGGTPYTWDDITNVIGGDHVRTMHRRTVGLGI